MKDFITKKKIFIFISFISILILTIILNKSTAFSIEKDHVSSTIIEEIAFKNNQENNDYFYVDVKGAVKKPGVYKFTNKQLVIDAIEAASGLTKSATTSNLNLSKKLKPEMVIYVFAKTELEKNKNVNTYVCPVIDCICETIEINNCIEQEPIIEEQESETNNEEDVTLININTATSDQLQTLPGIGLAKATAIIDYRQINKFEKIEDIKNVSGIGDSTFNSLKDLITI